MYKNKILVTGGTGFIGKALLRSLFDSGNSIVAPSRKSVSPLPINVSMPLLPDIGLLSDRSDLIEGCNVAIHLAAKAHVVGDPLSAFRCTNTDATLSFANQCARLGVKRFIFLSSIGVNGIQSDKPFTASDIPAPVEDYAVSKLEAEIGLRKIAQDTGMEVVIIRPPLVYGANAPGNFGKLAKLAQKNLPLPLGAIYNKRSLVALDNLVDLILTCIDHPNAANQTFLVSDGCDVSTTELLKLMTLATGKSPCLLPVPVPFSITCR